MCTAHSMRRNAAANTVVEAAVKAYRASLLALSADNKYWPCAELTEADSPPPPWLCPCPCSLWSPLWEVDEEEEEEEEEEEGVCTAAILTAPAQECMKQLRLLAMRLRLLLA